MNSIIALLFILLGLPLSREMEKPNSWYGARVSVYVFKDEEIWYRMNRLCGRQSVALGSVMGLIAAFSAFYIGSPGAHHAGIHLHASRVGDIRYYSNGADGPQAHQGEGAARGVTADENVVPCARPNRVF